MVFIGCGMQAFTSTAAILLLALLLLNDTSSNDAGFSLILFILLCLCGIIENTGAGIVSVAVEKDWVPTVFEGFSGAAAATSAVDDNGDDEEGKKDDLTQINANMARIDLIAEFAGPVMAGLVLSFFDERPAKTLQGMMTEGWEASFGEEQQTKCDEIPPTEVLNELITLNDDGRCPAEVMEGVGATVVPEAACRDERSLRVQSFQQRSAAPAQRSISSSG